MQKQREPCWEIHKNFSTGSVTIDSFKTPLPTVIWDDDFHSFLGMKVTSRWPNNLAALSFSYKLDKNFKGFILLFAFHNHHPPGSREAHFISEFAKKMTAHHN